MGDLQERVAIVTGGATGLGKALSLGLARAGASVVIANRTREEAEAAVKEIEADGGQALAVPTDVTRRTDVERLIQRAVQEWGKLDILVNNAGGAILWERFLETTEENWNRIIATHLTGTFLCSQAAARQMVIQGEGRIVNIASQAGLSYSVWQGPHYHAAKAGVIHLTTVMAMELGPYNIRVNAVAPGFTESPSSAPLLPTPHAREIVLSQIPLGRLGTADDVVQAVLFLASDRAAYITGQTLVVNGGSLGFSRDPRQT